MLPGTIGVIAWLSLGFVFGVVLQVTRSRLMSERDANEALGVEQRKALAEARHLERRLALREEQLSRAKQERDDYATIASSHELTFKGWKPGQWAKKVWKARRYAGHPSSNLEALTTDFAEFGDNVVIARLDIELLGGWKQLLDPDTRSYGITEPLSAGQTLVFEGPAPRVLKQMSTFLRDDDTGFVEVDETGEKRWRDADSTMNWILTVDVLQGDPKPAVEFVEVLRVQKEIVERVVERPVLREVPPELMKRLSAHKPEELIPLIEAVLEVRELDHGLRLQAEAKALRSVEP